MSARLRGEETTLMSAPLLELLSWIAERPRTYGETMEAWRTSCPRMPVWEDATLAGLIEVVSGPEDSLLESMVRLTAAGRAMLAAARDDGDRDV